MSITLASNSIFLGENSSSSGQANETVQVSGGVPLGANTSIKIKNKIWNNEFVDMRSLM